MMIYDDCRSHQAWHERSEEAQEAEEAGEDDDGWTPVQGRGGRGAVHDAEEKEEVKEYGAGGECRRS